MLLELKSSVFVLQSQIYLLALGEILNLWRRSVQRYVPDRMFHLYFSNIHGQFMWTVKVLVSLLRTELVLLMSLHIYKG